MYDPFALLLLLHILVGGTLLRGCICEECVECIWKIVWFREFFFTIPDDTWGW